MLSELKRAVIPATVRMVESCAFACCNKLTDLVIEGDLSRVASWHEDAFEDCACESEYLTLRRKAAESDNARRRQSAPDTPRCLVTSTTDHDT